MKDTKSIVILIFSLLIGVQQWEHRIALRKSQDQTWRAITAATEAQEGWQKTIEQLKVFQGKSNLDQFIRQGTVKDQHGITYYLSSGDQWHSNRVVGEFYLNDKTWEEFKP